MSAILAYETARCTLKPLVAANDKAISDDTQSDICPPCFHFSMLPSFANCKHAFANCQRRRHVSTIPLTESLLFRVLHFSRFARVGTCCHVLQGTAPPSLRLPHNLFCRHHCQSSLVCAPACLWTARTETH